MRHLQLRWPATTVVSLAAAAATWVTLLAWTPFSERPGAYMTPLLWTCLAIAAAGALLRTGRLPALAVAGLQLLLVAALLHHQWAAEEAVAAWIPTPESLALLRETLSEAFRSAQEYSSPVPRSVTQFAPLMVSAGAATAVLVDFLANGLRRAPLAGLPLLAVYTAPISILDGGVSWAKFAAAALCFLILIAAQEASRLAHWGQQVSLPGSPPDPMRTGQAVWSSARKIGLSATGLAVVVPLVVPTLSLRLFDGPGGIGGAGDGVSLSNPIVNMRRDLTRGTDVDLLRLRTEGDPTYLRTTVLDSFDGETWRPSRRNVPVEQRASGLVPRPAGLDAEVERRTVPWSIQVTEAFESRWLPVPYPVYSINAAGDWRYDRSTLDFVSFANGQTAAGLRYDLEGIELAPTAEQLADAAPAPAFIFGPNTDVPDRISPSVRQLARQVTTGAGDKYEQAKALQRWFRVDGGFVYSLERASGNGLDELDQFLGTGEGGRVGYCEQFASAMALMSRSLGIPARVAVGFLRPDPVGEDTYVYSAHDLHAWPELYFEGTGWVRFEPTPADRTGAAPAYSRGAVGGEDPTESSSSAAPGPSLNRFDQPSAAPGTNGTSTADGSGGAGGLLGGLAGAAIAVAVMVGPRALRGLRRRRRWAAATTPAGLAEAAWAELRDSALDLGVAWSDSVTLRTRARELVRSFGSPEQDGDALRRASGRGPEADPEATHALERIVQRLEIARYARRVPATRSERADAQGDVESCVRALAAGASARQRTRARWLPTSLAEWRPARRLVRLNGAVDEAGVDHAV